MAALEPLQRFPLLGPSREGLAPGLRVSFHGSYAIYYAPCEDAVVIIRVLHGARDIEAFAANRGFEA